MRKFLLIGLLGALSGFAAPILTVTPTLGPNFGTSVNFDAWAANVIANLKNSSAPDGSGVQTYVPLANGANLTGGEFIATENQNFQSWQGVAPGPFAGELGTTIYFSVVVTDSAGATFSLADLYVDETYIGQAFGASAIGGNYRPAAQGITAGDVTLSSGEAGSSLVKALYYVGVGFSAQTSSAVGTNQDKINAAIADIQALSDRTTQACYAIGTQPSVCGSVNVQGSIPEPGTWALISAGLAGLAFLRRRSA